MNKGHFPEPIAGAFILNEKNELFLMKSHKWSDKWVVPGGHIEIGETIAEALQREVKEETNLHVSHPSFICLWEFINDKEFHDKRHMLFLNYQVIATSNDVKLNNEGQEYGWFGEKEVLDLDLNHYTKMTIEKFPEKVFRPQLQPEE